MIDLEIFDAPSPSGSLRIDVGNEDCYNYVLQGQSTCDESGEIPNTIPLNTMLRPIQYEEIEEGTENGAGVFTRSYLAQKRVFSFQVDVDDYWLDILKQFVVIYDQLWFGAKNKGSNEIVNLRIGNAEQIPDSNLYEVEITFEDPEIREKSGCCGSVYQDAPYEDPCDDDEGSGEPDPEDPCPSFEVDLQYDGNAINASTSGGPTSGGVTYRWYYDATGSGILTLIAEGGISSVVPGGAGVYRVIAIKGGCQAVDEILVQDECALFQVITSFENGVIGSTIVASQGNPVYTWTYIDELANETVLPDTSPEIIPEQSGFYRLDVVDGDCMGSDTVFVDLIEECPMTASIVREGNTLTGSATGCSETVTYEWTADYGNGPQVVGTGNTLEVSQSGVYFLTAACGSICTDTVYVVVLLPCDPCEGVTFSITEDNGSLMANTSGATGGTITWYLNSGSGMTAIGNGPSVAIDQGGMYIAEWKVGECTKTAEYLHCDTGGGTISFSELCNDE